MHKSLPDDILAEPWCRKGECGIWLSRSAWSLLAIAECYSRLNGGRKPAVWLPDFFCNSSLFPLREAGISLVFYPITTDLNPDTEWLCANSSALKPDIFILVHYFGQPARVEKVTEFCKDNGTWLIEDATHVLKPIMGVGEYGDFVLYSQHKHLAIPDGALLVVRNNGPSKLSNELSSNIAIKEVAHELIESSSKSKSSIVFWLIKRTLQLLGAGGKKQKAPFWPDRDYHGKYFEYTKMSDLAKRLLSVSSHDLEIISQSRISNLEIWKNFICKPGVGLNSVNPLKMNETPYLAAFMIEDFDSITSLYNKLRHAGFPITTWPDLPPEVIGDPVKHSAAILLRKTRFYLSVQQTLKLKRDLKKFSVLSDL
jgi:dTDP-4-amino-4,6-dideoxygalactose transaminase